MRTHERKKSHGEVFTPSELCKEILDKLPLETWTDSTKTFLDPSCGNGNFLVEIKTRLKSYGHDPINILSRIYGVDIMRDNCIDCIERLYGYTEDKLTIYEDNLPDGVLAYFYKDGKMLNIVQADALKYDFEFTKPNIESKFLEEVVEVKVEPVIELPEIVIQPVAPVIVHNTSPVAIRSSSGILYDIKIEYDRINPSMLSSNINQNRYLKIRIPNMNVTNTHFEFTYLSRLNSVRISLHFEDLLITQKLTQYVEFLINRILDSSYTYNEWDNGKGYDLHIIYNLSSFSATEIATKMRDFIDKLLPVHSKMFNHVII